MIANSNTRRNRDQHWVAQMHALLGGYCASCGSNADLQIHHVDPKQKLFNPTSCNRSWPAIVAELEKCQLRCEPCHKLEHAVPHGTAGRYRVQQCRCDECVSAYRQWKIADGRRYRANLSGKRLRQYREKAKIRARLSQLKKQQANKYGPDPHVQLPQ
jgi:hypothetical protein